MSKKNISEENARYLKILSQNIKSLREAKNLSLQELSQQCGVSEKILTEMEAGEDFEVRYLVHLCRFYRIKPHEVFSLMD